MAHTTQAKEQKGTGSREQKVEEAEGEKLSPKNGSAKKFKNKFWDT